MNPQDEIVCAYVDGMQKHINQLLDENDVLKAENESLRKDAARFAYIEQDADSGMSKIYGDDWLAVIDSAISSPENHS